MKVIGHRGILLGGDLGEQLDRRDVPKCQLCRTAGKNGGTNIYPRSFWFAASIQVLGWEWLVHWLLAFPS